MKKKFIILIIFIVVLAVIGSITVISSGILNPYEHQLKLGDKLLSEEKFEQAALAFQKAIEVQSNSVDAIMGAEKAYVALGKFDEAENMLKKIIEIDDKNELAYIELLDVYLQSGKIDEANQFVNTYEANNIPSLMNVRPKAPESKQTSDTYDKPVQVELIADANDTIYFTTDGNDPSTKSEKYTNPIQLNNNGTYQVKAVSVNPKGILSKVSVYNYTIHLPVEPKQEQEDTQAQTNTSKSDEKNADESDLVKRAQKIFAEVFGGTDEQYQVGLEMGKDGYYRTGLVWNLKPKTVSGRLGFFKFTMDFTKLYRVEYDGLNMDDEISSSLIWSK